MKPVERTVRYLLPMEMKIESYDSKKFFTTFDRVYLAVEFKAGINDIGAIFHQWKEAIPAHDVVVKEVEDQMDYIKVLRKAYNIKTKIFKNWDAALNIING